MLDTRLGKEEVRQLYSRFASCYDVWANLAESQARQLSLQIADIHDGDAVLEVAVGTGLIFAELLKRNPSGRNEGIDLAAPMLAQARERAEKTGVSHYTLKVGDAYALEFADNTFDVLLNHYMFDLLPEADFVQVLIEFKRVLKSGGKLVLVSMTQGQPWFNWLWEGLHRLNPALLGGCRGVVLQPCVQAAGFAEVQRQYLSQWMFPSEVICGIKP
jgi:ubiquinone/menaquinone biosynthesis C-methylase UbiE